MTGEDRERRRADTAQAQADAAGHRADVAEARPGWYWWAVMAVTSVLGPSIAIGISRHNQRESEQAWCEVITVLDEGYRDPAPGTPPLTPRGQRIAAGIAHVRETYHC